jgi:hypothetical protein
VEQMFDIIGQYYNNDPDQPESIVFERKVFTIQ